MRFRSGLRRRRFGRKQVFGALLAAAGILLLGLYLFNVRMLPVIRAMALNNARNMATAAINDAAGRVLQRQKVDYAKLMTLEKDSGGNIVAVEANTTEINLLKYEITNEALEEIKGINTSDLGIPVGTIVGGQLFTGLGPRVRVRIEPVGNVRSEFINTFGAAGINQTRQEISLDVDAQIAVIVSSFTFDTEVQSNFVIADIVIVGGVPSTYFESSGSGSDTSTDSAYLYGAQAGASGSSSAASKSASSSANVSPK